MLPLDGITVVSIEQAVAAPFATRQLADYGARVIKIERPDGGDFARSYDAAVNGLSSYFVWLNRSKQSLTLDLKNPAARAVFDRLIATADVFVHNLAPGAVERLGAAPADLRARDPRLVTCSISGYGSPGPYAGKKAYDMLVQAEAGLVSITGSRDTPSRVGISVADIAAGMYAYSGILTALLARSTSGEGTGLDVSLFDALGEWMGAPAYYTEYGGTEPPRCGAAHATIAPYELFVSQEGVEIFLAIQNAREWTRFCQSVVEQPALAADPRFASNASRVRHRDELHAMIADVFARMTATAIVGRLEAADIAFARRNSVAEFVGHPQLAARDCWTEVASPVGSLRALRPPVRMSGVDPVMAAVPALGEHSEAILGELGFDAATIAGWRKEQMI
ncbi:MAG TPA: CaiB/BaiF CoA-transferase family protein [Vicinamibacterales bacterium]|nr:CaiB/BaiF CoA-transferase family protein [Vicinamibacterales bacterium]